MDPQVQAVARFFIIQLQALTVVLNLQAQEALPEVYVIT
jgi:hypothetical protein